MRDDEALGSKERLIMKRGLSAGPRPFIPVRFVMPVCAELPAPPRDKVVKDWIATG